MSRWCKIAILTDEVSQELEDVIRFAKEFQLDGIEVRSLFGRAFKDLTKEDLTKIKSAADEAGLQIAGAASPVFKCNLDVPAEIEEHFELFKRSCEAAHTLGTDMVRVFTFLRKSHPATSAELAQAASHFPRLFEIARAEGVRVGIENEASTIVGTGAEVKEFLSHLAPDPVYTVVWDPCNVLYLSGENDPIRDDLAAIIDRVGHVHIKDAARQGTEPAATCVELGKGTIDFPRQFTMLKERGYNGWVTLETHWRSVPLDEATQHLPAGYGFSANAEPASRICMAHLQRYIDQA